MHHRAPARPEDFDLEFRAVRDALARQEPDGDRLRTVMRVAADVVAYEPIFDGGDVIGFCTSGGYAHYSARSVAIGFLPRERIADGAEFEIEILGSRRRAVAHQTPLFDPDASRMRG